MRNRGVLIFETIENDCELYDTQVWIFLQLVGFAQVGPKAKFYICVGSGRKDGILNNSRSQNLSLQPRNWKDKFAMEKIDVATSLQPACFRLQSACFHLQSACNRPFADENKPVAGRLQAQSSLLQADYRRKPASCRPITDQNKPVAGPLQTKTSRLQTFASQLQMKTGSIEPATGSM